MIERQSLTQKNIIHLAGGIDIELEPGMFSAAKLIDTVCCYRGRLVKNVRRHCFCQFWINPVDRFRRPQRRTDIREPRLVMSVIVGHRPGRNAFVADDAKICVGYGTIAKVNLGRHAIKSDCAKSSAIKL